MNPRKENAPTGNRRGAEEVNLGERQHSTLPAALLTREACKVALGRVVGPTLSVDERAKLLARIKKELEAQG
jgi:hypothetical protein